MLENVNIPQVMRWLEIIGQQLFLWLMFAAVFWAVIVLPKYLLSIAYYIVSRIAVYLALLIKTLRGGGRFRLLRVPFLSLLFPAPDVLIYSGSDEIRITFIDDVTAFRSMVTAKDGGDVVITTISSGIVRKAVRQGDTYAVTGSGYLGQGDDHRRRVGVRARKGCADVLLVSPKPLLLCRHMTSRVEPVYEPARIGAFTVCTWKMFSKML
ncbi:MAG: hypothetical protein K6D94_08605 [Clostridiales bacterium]|nr:hypothetical protein [Clostridiales bacterium]